MNYQALIAKKLRGESFTELECQECLLAYRHRQITDAQMASLWTALQLQECAPQEALAWTKALLPEWTAQRPFIPTNRNQRVVGYESTGWLGDKTDLIIAPILVALGFDVVSLIHASPRLMTLATKLQTVGVHLHEDQHQSHLDQFHFCYAKAYPYSPAHHLDQLCTQIGVPTNLPLWAGKLLGQQPDVGHPEQLIVDIKAGLDWPQPSPQAAPKLANLLLETVQLLPNHPQVIPLLTMMDQPIGRMVGTQNEVLEAIWFLEGDPRVANDLRQLVEQMVTHLLVATGQVATLKEAKHQYVCALDSRRALKILLDYLLNHMPDVAQRRQLVQRKFWTPTHHAVLTANSTGYVTFTTIQTIAEVYESLGQTSADLDVAAGLEFTRKAGERVHQGEPLAVLHANHPIAPALVTKLATAIQVNPKKDSSNRGRTSAKTRGDLTPLQQVNGWCTPQVFTAPVVTKSKKTRTIVQQKAKRNRPC